MNPATGSRRPDDVVTVSANLDAARWLSANTSVEVVPIGQPVIEALGHHPTSHYAEHFWLPVIGPSALWTHRRLAAGLAANGSGYYLHLPTLSREIGLGTGTGRSSPIVRTMARLVDFHLAEIVDDRLGVYTSLPPLTRRQAARLPDHLARRHDNLVTRRPGCSPYAARLGAEIAP